MSLTTRSFTAFAVLGLAACSSATPPAATPPPAQEQPDCGAGALGSYIGTPGTDAAIAAIQAWRGDKPLRVLKPGSVMTMDYRFDRLNIELDDKGVIKSVRCG
ncbi:I78 family peptidase inhibitor [Novosphingobium colocasiae]|uniref:Peptidase inhibitor I78 n=1 Tax=Novosphingobium colocasiae TaxID=1256513 RepID=A0A918PHM1_9SPHN|nr:I78 family peptidase inhibitor [Novosphingobium colocasiae]GGZ10428.1 hypothetical protein GCM10011614_26670 [Novosphingobium colocasiae]